MLQPGPQRSITPHEPSVQTPSERPETTRPTWRERALAPFRRAFEDESATIEQRMFRGLTLLGGLAAIFVVVPLNFPQSLPPFVNIAVFAFGAVCLLLHGATHRGHYGKKLLFLLLMITLDLIWFGNAGSQGSIGLFFFTAAMYLVIFFQGRTRWLMMGLHLANGVSLLWFEHLHPDLVWAFPTADARFLDLVTGFVLCSLVCILILWVVLAAYHREHERLAASLEAQRQNEAHFRALVMHSPIAIAVSGSDGRLDYVNHQFEKVLGYSVADLPSIDAWWELAYPDPSLREQAHHAWIVACGRAAATDGLVPPAEFPVRCRDGRTAQLEIQAALIGDRWLTMFTDISDRRRNEEAMRQAQKLESLGVLAGGIAHDFNNLLSAMLGNLDLAQMKLPPGASSAPYLANMEATIQKAAGLTRQMLAYSGRGRFVVEPLDLSRMVAEITHLLTVSISKMVRLEYELAEGLPALEGDAAQIQQVVMNLVTNASEAIGEEGGTIRVGTSLRLVSRQEADIAFAGQNLHPGRYVQLRVEDTGCGMTPEVLERLFDPFFSTKGSGRGLGLSAMLGILRGHGAGIEIQSEPGRGSTFRVLFPATEATAAGAPAPVPAASGGRFAGRVLVVDDEADLRFSYGSMLQHLGFQVSAARDGFEALERFEPGRFALVFMDLTMPRMGGQEAFLQMKARDPEVKVVLVSGYNEREAIESLRGVQPTAFIQKPFSLKVLTAVLESVLP